MATGTQDLADRGMKPCPICGKAAAMVHLPFCSKRCADVDLHRWLGGVYAVPADDGESSGLPSDVSSEDEG